MNKVILILLVLTLPYAYNLQGMNSGPKDRDYDKRFLVWVKPQKNYDCDSRLAALFGAKKEHGLYCIFHRGKSNGKRKYAQFTYSTAIDANPELKDYPAYPRLTDACYILDDNPKNLYTIVKCRYNDHGLQIYKQAKTGVEAYKAQQKIERQESTLHVTAKEIKEHLQYDEKHLVKLVSWIREKFLYSHVNWNIPEVIKEKINTIEKQL